MTRLERARADAAAREVGWDEVRERRVLARIKHARASEGRRPSPTRPWRVGIAVAGATATVTLAFALLVLGGGRDAAPEQPRVATPTPPNAAAPERSPRVAPPEPLPRRGSQMRLTDGSLATLGPGAELELVDVDGDASEGSRVVVEQSAGEVRYEVRKQAEREFVVRSRGVEVRVVGTVFSVVASEARVFVEVERGRVVVVAGARRSELGPGDSLGIQLDTLGSEPATEPEPVTERPVPDAQPRSGKPSKPPASTSVAELLAEVDAARLAGDDAHAAELLRTVLRDHADDPRATTAAFTLGRVERVRGRHREAARAFASYLARAPNGVLAEDALAEQARAWADAGDKARAKTAAEASLARWPQGTHAARMRELAGE